MARRLHGILSIVVFLIAVGLAAWGVFRHSAPAGWLYIAVAAAGTLGVVYSFCCKCCCKHRCSHVVLGMIARLLPSRRVGKYSRWDVAGMASSFLAIVIFPQFWIWSEPLLAVTFWLLAALIVWEIARKVCPHCNNVLCPFHPRPG